MKTIPFLQTVYITVLITAALLAWCFESGMLTIDWAPDDSQSYILDMIGLALTICWIPLSLKMLHFQRIKAIIQCNEPKYRTWSIIRIVLLATALIYNIFIYYLLGCNTGSFYLALMVFVAMLFIWPTHSRMEYECDMPQKK